MNEIPPGNDPEREALTEDILEIRKAIDEILIARKLTAGQSAFNRLSPELQERWAGAELRIELIGRENREGLQNLKDEMKLLYEAIVKTLKSRSN